MILAQKFLNIIQDKVQIWEFFEIYQDKLLAKYKAASLFIDYDGVRVKQTKENSFIIQVWTYPRRDM